MTEIEKRAKRFKKANGGIDYRCDRCSEPILTEAAGVSWSQTWHYAKGSPDLDDPVYRCSPCTDTHGIRPTNCAHPERYQGRNPTFPTKE